ncbi:MAG TPA: hypothetical protein VGM44_02125 [Polyangiaceae bacterium]|jgi:hypothetical protein
MTTRIGVGGPAPDVLALTTAARVTPAPARPFQQVVNASSLAIANGAEAAINHLPGGSILAAAMRPGVGVGVGGVATAPAASAIGSTGTAAPSIGAGTSGISGSPTGDPAMEQMMSQDADQNMYYLQLQEQMSQESRSYSAVSNVLKARHDTMKNAIGNIR